MFFISNFIIFFLGLKKDWMPIFFLKSVLSPFDNTTSFAALSFMVVIWVLYSCLAWCTFANKCSFHLEIMKVLLVLTFKEILHTSHCIYIPFWYNVTWLKSFFLEYSNLYYSSPYFFSFNCIIIRLHEFNYIPTS